MMEQFLLVLWRGQINEYGYVHPLFRGKTWNWGWMLGLPKRRTMMMMMVMCCCWVIYNLEQDKKSSKNNIEPWRRSRGLSAIYPWSEFCVCFYTVVASLEAMMMVWWLTEWRTIWIVMGTTWEVVMNGELICFSFKTYLWLLRCLNCCCCFS